MSGVSVILLSGKRKAVIILAQKKIGRPTTNPRPNKLSIRLSDKTLKKLERYCEQESVNKTEAVERAIDKLESKTKSEAQQPDQEH